MVFLLYVGAAAGPASLRGICNRRWRGSEWRGALWFPADRRRQQGLGTLPHRRHIRSHHHDGEARPREARPPQRESSCMCAGLFHRCRLRTSCDWRRNSESPHVSYLQLIIVARDMGQPVPYETTQPLQVALLDIDDNEPVFLKPPVRQQLFYPRRDLLQGPVCSIQFR